jgi:hypothetical protein
VPDQVRVGAASRESDRHPWRCLFDRSALESPAVTAHWKDKLMDRNDASQDRLDFKMALIVTLLSSVCLWPVVWELTSAVVQYLKPYSK